MFRMVGEGSAIAKHLLRRTGLFLGSVKIPADNTISRFPVSNIPVWRAVRPALAYPGAGQLPQHEQNHPVVRS